MLYCSSPCHSEDDFNGTVCGCLCYRTANMTERWSSVFNEWQETSKHLYLTFAQTVQFEFELGEPPASFFFTCTHTHYTAFQGKIHVHLSASSTHGNQPTSSFLINSLKTTKTTVLRLTWVSLHKTLFNFYGIKRRMKIFLNNPQNKSTKAKFCSIFFYFYFHNNYVVSLLTQ